MIEYSYIGSFKNLFNRFPKKKKEYFWLLLLAMVVAALVETAAVCVIAFFASAISDPDGVITSKYIRFAREFADFDFLYSIRGIIAAAAVMTITVVGLKNTMNGMVAYWRARFSADVEAHFGKILLNGFLSMPYEWQISQNSADLINAVLWRKYMGQKFIIPYLQIFNDMLMMLAMLAVLLIVQPLVSLAVTLIVGLSAMFIYKNVRSRIDRMAKAAMGFDLTINKETTKAVHGVKDIKISLTKDSFVKRFTDQAVPLSRIIGRQIGYGELPVLLLEIIGFALMGVTVCILLFWTSNSTAIVTGTMALLAVVAWRVLPALSRVVGSISKIRNALPYLNSQLDYLDMIEEFENRKIILTSNTRKPLTFKEEIRFEDVCFGYNRSDRYVLNHLNFTIKKGATTGIIGTSGAGKSTLVDLLTGLLSMSEGAIYIDDLPLTAHNYQVWVGKIGYVSQSPYIYDGTLSENIAFGVPENEIDTDQVIRCSKMAAMDDFLSDLPDYIDSYIGERGTKLSGGQQQRVSIARALYSNPEIMIFDEATSALDSKSENEIMKTIYSLKGKLTLIIIAHRLSTVKKCDQLIWMESGTIRMIDEAETVIKQYEKTI